MHPCAITQNRSGEPISIHRGSAPVFVAPIFIELPTRTSEARPIATTTSYRSLTYSSATRLSVGGAYRCDPGSALLSASTISHPSDGM